MKPSDWSGLVKGLVKFFSEEAQEPEHRAEDKAYDSKVFAFDKSVRTVDADGRLHVEKTNISKGNICPYYGKEIPDYEALGLDAEKKYLLWRHPDELAKGAPTFNNIPLLIKHVPVSAEDHQPDLVIGSTGTDAAFEAPYLTNSLVVWAQEAIDAIENEDQKELSSAYRYRADMTPGEFQGEHYDGIMRDIVGNHVALVKEGRAGSDIVVGDSQITRKEITMNKKVLSRKAAFIGGALSAYLHPKLAADSVLNLDPILKGVNSKNFSSKKSSIVSAIKSRATLAKDASLDDIHGLLDRLDETHVPEEDEMPANSAVPQYEEDEMEDSMDKKADDKKADDKKARDKKRADDKRADDKKARDAVRDMLDDEGKEAFDALFEHEEHDADDEMEDMSDDEESKEAEHNAEGLDKARDRKADDRKADDRKADDKRAMDSAIKRAKQEVREEMNAIAEAREFVAPWVGKLSVAMDSAADVYKTALEGLGVSTKGIHPSAYREILKAQPKAGSVSAKSLAQDSSNSTGFSSRFGNADRIKLVG